MNNSIIIIIIAIGAGIAFAPEEQEILHPPFILSCGQIGGYEMFTAVDKTGTIEITCEKHPEEIKIIGKEK